MSRSSGRQKQVALIFVEGDTEEEFYKKLLDGYLRGIPKSVINLKGIYNVHRKLLGKTLDFLHKHKDYTVRVYCCIDMECRDHNPPLDIDDLQNSFCEDQDFKRVKSADAVFAIQMIESWFFYDINGINEFLKVPRKARNPAKFSPPAKYTHIDLSKLFQRYGKTYIKGHKCANFIDHLNLEKICNDCVELKAWLELIKRQATN